MRTWVAVFPDAGGILAGARAARGAGWRIREAYTPVPVHGLAESLGHAPSRLPIVCFLFGLVGAAASLYFQYWASAIAWPINIGGKPWNSLPAFIPVSFEVMVLCAGLGVVGTFLVRAGLFPGRRPRARDPRATDDKFLLVLVPTDATRDLASARALLLALGAEEVVERVDDGAVS